MHLPVGTIAACALALAWGQASAVPRYTATPLGTLGGAYSRAYAINAHGQVTGEAQRADGTWHAFLWTEGAMRDVDTLGSVESQGLAINAAGHVVGCARSTGSSFAVVYDGEHMQDLRTVTGDAKLACATGINDAGHVVGYRWSSPGPIKEPSFLYADGVVHDVRQAPVAINNRDDLAGTADRYLNPPLGWVRVAGAYLTPYPLLDWASQSFVFAINDDGRAVGWGGSPDGGEAFVFANGVRTDLGTGFTPMAISNRGEIVGQIADHGSGEGRAALYTAQTRYDINALVVAGLDGAILTLAVGINDAGTIAANACTRANPPDPPSLYVPRCKAFRLDPVADAEVPIPVNALWALATLAVAVCAGALPLRRVR